MITDTEAQDPLFEENIIYAYTRKQALEDGEQVDANIGDFAEVTRQHYKYPVFMTRSVFDIINRAVDNAKYCNDYKGIWHDILWMSRNYKSNGDTVHFNVIITGVGRKKTFHMLAQCGPMDIDDPRPVITVMLPEDI
jgi:hypothetical protein